MKIKIILMFITLTILNGCISAQLSTGGMQVEYVINGDAPSGYTEIGKVEIHDFESGVTYPDAVVRLRNKAGEMGGDFLVIDNIKYQDIDFTIYYTGYGRVYKK